MPPTLLLIRHAQALHNVSSDWTIHDPRLTSLGEEQCKDLQTSLKNSKIGNDVELIVVSAMRRTLQTAHLGLDYLLKKGVKVLPDAGWQENADKPCDTGSSIPIMVKEFPDFDFSMVDPQFPDKTTNLSSNPYAFTREAILARGQTCLKSLYHRPEKVIAVVSHSGFMRVAVAHRRFANADWRVFDFDEDKTQESGTFVLREWQETEEKGGGMGHSEKGVFGVTALDFPHAPRVVEEATKEKPT